MLKFIHGVVIQLEHYKPLTISTANLFKATRVVADTSSARIWVDWLDQVSRIFMEEGVSFTTPKGRKLGGKD